jgi:hypothetical protein
MNQYLTYKKFYTLDEAQELLDILKQNNISGQIQDDTIRKADFTVLDDNSPKVAIKLRPEDFPVVNSLLGEQAKKQVDLSEADKDHPLFTFTNDELLEVVMESDSWSAYDVALAKEILVKNGIVVSEAMEGVFKEKRLKELAKFEPAGSAWTIFGYVSALLGGILGIIIGWNLWKSKKTLPNGERLYTYSDKDREHGIRIVIIGVVMFVLILTLRIVYRLW